VSRAGCWREERLVTGRKLGGMATSVTAAGPGLCPGCGVQMVIRQKGKIPGTCSARCRKRLQRQRERAGVEEVAGTAGKPLSGGPVPVQAALVNGRPGRMVAAPAPPPLPSHRPPLPKRRVLAPRDGVVTPKAAELWMLLGVVGLGINPSAGCGMCVIRVRTGRETFIDCLLPVFPGWPGLCGRHGRQLGDLLASHQAVR
jgi:hypothetical protein